MEYLDFERIVFYVLFFVIYFVDIVFFIKLMYI